MSPQSFDKQFVRDYLETLSWDPISWRRQLPSGGAGLTSEKYLEAYSRLTGQPLVKP